MSDKKNTEKNLDTEEAAIGMDEEIAPELRDVDAEEVKKGETCEDLKAEVQKLQLELADRHDKYLRALADCENFKKRALKERSELLKYQGEKVLLDMVDVLDDFERALEHVESDPTQLKAGVELIYKNFLNILEKWGVKGESALGTQFDPVKQNALSVVQVTDAAPGTVISEFKKTYFYKDKLLRAGAVVVAEAKPTMDEAELPEADLKAACDEKIKED